MKSPNVLTATAILVGMTSVSLAGRQITRSDLPISVQKTADAESIGAKVLGYAKDLEKGKPEYEVQLMVDGHAKDVTIDRQGNLLEQTLHGGRIGPLRCAERGQEAQKKESADLRKLSTTNEHMVTQRYPPKSCTFVTIMLPF